MDPVKGQQHIDGFIGATPELTPASKTAAEAVTRRWCAGAGLDEAATVEMLDMLGLGNSPRQ